MTEAATPQLEYAPPLAWHQVRRWRRRLVVVGLVLTTVGFLYWAPSLWQHARLLYWQRQCLAYAAPAEQVVFEPDPQRLATLAKGDDWVLGVSPLAIVHSPRAWRGMSAAGLPWRVAPEPVIGLLTRRTSNDTTWLVAIHLTPTPQPALFARLCTPATLTDGPKHFRGQS